MNRLTSNNEHGATAILVALSLLVLMGFAAIAVDTGVLVSDRRQQQSGADTGTLAAAQFARTTLGTANATCATLSGIDYAACRGAEEVFDVVEGTLPGRYTAADWTACADANLPAAFTQTSHLSPCINYTANMQEVRVVLPGTDVDTTFARLLGINSVNIGAFAHARLDIEASADILPFAVGPTGAGQTQSCLFAQATAQLNILPCDGSSSGNFGKLDLSLYGNTTLGTTQDCGNSAPQFKMAVNIAVGADHPFEIHTASAGIINEVTNCPIITNPVDQIPVQTGNAAQGISNGLFYGISTPSREGRLMCKDGDANEQPGKTSTSCLDVYNQFPENLDDTPLWQFLTPGAAAESGGACAIGTVVDRTTMDACLAAWKAWPGVHAVTLFNDQIAASPRFAAVPILDNDPSNGSGNYLITGFKPVYLETIYLKCNANTCDTIYSPGESGFPATTAACVSPVTPATSSCGVVGNGNANSIEALTSFMIDEDMLPASINDNFPYKPGTIVFNLSR